MNEPIQVTKELNLLDQINIGKFIDSGLSDLPTKSEFSSILQKSTASSSPIVDHSPGNDDYNFPANNDREDIREHHIAEDRNKRPRQNDDYNHEVGDGAASDNSGIKDLERQKSDKLIADTERSSSGEDGMNNHENTGETDDIIGKGHKDAPLNTQSGDTSDIPINEEGFDNISIDGDKFDAELARLINTGEDTENLDVVTVADSSLVEENQGIDSESVQPKNSAEEMKGEYLNLQSPDNEIDPEIEAVNHINPADLDDYADQIIDEENVQEMGTEKVAPEKLPLNKLPAEELLTEDISMEDTDMKDITMEEAATESITENDIHEEMNFQEDHDIDKPGNIKETALNKPDEEIVDLASKLIEKKEELTDADPAGDEHSIDIKEKTDKKSDHLKIVDTLAEAEESGYAEGDDIVQTNRNSLMPESMNISKSNISKTISPNNSGAVSVDIESDSSGLMNNSNIAQEGARSGERLLAPDSVKAGEFREVLDKIVHVAKNNNKLAVTIDHERFGKLNIRLSLEKGLVNIQVNTTDNAMKEFVANNVQYIVDSLTKDGVSVGGFSVALKNQKEDSGYRQFMDSGRKKDYEEINKAINAPANKGLINVFA